MMTVDQERSRTASDGVPEHGAVLISLRHRPGREGLGQLAGDIAREERRHRREILGSVRRESAIRIDGSLGNVDSRSLDIFVKVLATLTTDQLVSVLSIWEPR